MRHGNPEVCEVYGTKSVETVCETEVYHFFLNVRLFASSNVKNAAYDLLGYTIQISKPIARQLQACLKDEPERNVIVKVVEKEYDVRLNFSKIENKYKVMDTDKTILLGYIAEKTLAHFAGD